MEKMKSSSIHRFSAVSDVSQVQDLVSIGELSSPFTSRAPSFPSVPNLAEFSSRSLDEIDDVALYKRVKELERKIRHLKVENPVFCRFLEKNDPGSLKDLEVLLHPSRIRTDRISGSSRTLSLLTKHHTGRSSLLLTPTIFAEKAPKINITQRSDLVMRDLEENQIRVQEIKKKSQRVKFRLVAKLEEIETRKEELEKSIESFEQFRQNYDQIPLEKFVRFMEEWSKKSRLMADKVRLRYSSLKVQYQKLAATLAHKQLIGENLRNIDFEQLRIENLHLGEKIEQKQLLLIELKKMTGDGNLKLSQHKSILQQKIVEKEAIENTIKQIEKDITKSDDELVKTYIELDEVKHAFSKVQKKYSKYEPPDLMDYIKNKAKVSDLKKDLRMWHGRRHIREVALDVELNKMQKLLRCREPDPCWFE